MSYDHGDEPPAPRHARREQAPRPDDVAPQPYGNSTSFRNSGFFQGGFDVPRNQSHNPLLRAAQESPPDYRSVRAATGAGTPPRRRATLAAVAVVALLGGCGFAGFLGVRWVQSRPATSAAGEPDTAVKGAATTAPTPAGAKPANGRNAARLGVAVRDGSFAFKVTEVRDAGTVMLGSGADAVKADGRFVLVDVTVKNLGGTSRSLRPAQQLLQDSARNDYAPRTTIRLSTVLRLWTAIRPGAAVRGTMVFDVPQNQKVSDLLLQGAAASPGLDLSVH